MTNTIYTMFKNTADNHKNKTAIIENQRTMTFGELSDLVDIIAGSFPKTITSIGIIMNHNAEMIASILAVLKCGAMYVPAEPSFPTGRIHYMMNEANVDFILTEREYAEKLNKFLLQFIDCLENSAIESTDERTDKLPSNPSSPAYVLYTSGTTGNPKGICVTNGNVCHYVQAFNNEFHITDKDIMLQYSVCTFDIFVEEVFASLLNGAAIAIASEEDKTNIHTLMEFVQKQSVTIISGFPYLLADMNNLSSIPSSIRLLISGGDVLRGDYVNNLLQQTEVYNTYGPSETTVCASYYHCNSGKILEDGTYPIGLPVKGSQIRILDAYGKEVTNGEKGEICIYGGGVSMGYIGSREEENKAFEIQTDGSRMYRSGDLGYILPDGNIAFLNRKDMQIMIYGKRVEVYEVESRLYQCKNIQQAIVRAFTDENCLSYMTAYIVFDDKTIKISDVKKELSENLPYFMIPEFFVKMPFIPLNTNGKPDIEKLPIVIK